MDAFRQLTTGYMRDQFNPKIINDENVKYDDSAKLTICAERSRYYSYGAVFDPPFWSIFSRSHAVISGREGPNDGLVSVESSKWGEYRGTLANVSHLDLINWTNRVNWYLRNLWGGTRPRSAWL